MTITTITMTNNDFYIRSEASAKAGWYKCIVLKIVLKIVLELPSWRQILLHDPTASNILFHSNPSLSF
ncbi:hypothetical protein M407DRAFT_25375 [Tulasnella calospora MUT 4182]|uniref:Uncharacterized protein n=1 Tax=Tulasnella calospora MUT 4182 TaxID=1051891 RepID=A0A0C3QG67_9AGAM|nr:hypothetical protein M407DRAFT_25375 [Tulasnella calospora MUT 4182]